MWIGIIAGRTGIEKHSHLEQGLEADKRQPFGCVAWRTLTVSANHLLGVLPRSFGQLGPTQHSGYFLSPVVASNRPNRGPRPAGRILLLNQIMMVGKGSNLRQMSDAQNLVAAIKTLAFTTPSAARPPMPVSTSSNTKVLCAPGFLLSPGPCYSMLAFSASITRESSPPDATCSSRRNGSAGFVEIM